MGRMDRVLYVPRVGGIEHRAIATELDARRPSFFALDDVGARRFYDLFFATYERESRELIARLQEEAGVIGRQKNDADSVAPSASLRSDLQESPGNSAKVRGRPRKVKP